MVVATSEKDVNRICALPWFGFSRCRNRGSYQFALLLLSASLLTFPSVSSLRLPHLLPLIICCSVDSSLRCTAGCLNLVRPFCHSRLL